MNRRTNLMTKTKQKLVRVLAIRSKGKSFFDQLAFWNLQKIKVSDIDFIVIHEGKGVVKNAFSLKRTKDGMYKMINDYSGQKMKNPYSETVFPDGSKRVSFVDFTFHDYRIDDLELFKDLALPKSKKGQVQPLQVFTVDLGGETPVIVEDRKSAKKAIQEEHS